MNTHSDYSAQDSVTPENPAATFTATLSAFTTSDYRMSTLRKAIKDGDAAEIADSLIYGNFDSMDGWTLVGEADITVRLRPESDLVAGQLAALNREMEAARAAWLTKQQSILERINSLQALEMTVEA